VGPVPRRQADESIDAFRGGEGSGAEQAGAVAHRDPRPFEILTEMKGVDGRALQEIRMAAKPDGNARVIAHNRKARFNYEIGETFEAGIALTGTEVKSLRQGKATIAESYADSRGGEIWLVNANIPEYLQGGRFNHAPKRVRKLLLHRRQINKLIGAVEREGMTLVPLKLYFNEKGRAKVELALARGKKLHDKRETEKKRSWERERGRLLRAKG
jgi:SsrA-binding protein